MGHQPFESWLLDEPELSSPQRQELAAHLESCPECTVLQASLEASTLLLKSTPEVAPAAGFTERWKVNLVERRARQHRRQTRLFFLSSIVGALVCLGGLYAILKIADFSIADLLVSGARVVTGLIGFFSQTGIFLGVNLKGPLPVIFWILISSGFCLLVFGWIYTLYRISFRGVFNNEKST
jgi:hypothetical protein